MVIGSDFLAVLCSRRNHFRRRLRRPFLGRARGSTIRGVT